MAGFWDGYNHPNPCINFNAPEIKSPERIMEDLPALSMFEHRDQAETEHYSVFSASNKSCGHGDALKEVEAEADEYTYVSGLAQQIAQSMLDEEENEDRFGIKPSFLSCRTEQCYTKMQQNQQHLPTSPQSTLQLNNASNVYSDNSSMGSSSPSGPSSGMSSPPTSGLNSYTDLSKDAITLDKQQQQQNAISSPSPAEMDLLYHQLLRLQIQEEARVQKDLLQRRLLNRQRQQQYQQKQQRIMIEQQRRMQEAAMNPRRRSYAAAVSGEDHRKTSVKEDEISQFYNKQAHQDHYQQQQQHNQIYQQVMQNRALLASRQASAGMRAVFLGSKPECAGTGVFLPRSRNAASATPKPACSTVLLPTHIVQALNLSVEDSLSAAPSQVSAVSGFRHSPNSISAPREVTPLQEVAPNICLPTEWTY